MKWEKILGLFCGIIAVVVIGLYLVNQMYATDQPLDPSNLHPINNPILGLGIAPILINLTILIVGFVIIGYFVHKWAWSLPTVEPEKKE